MKTGKILCGIGLIFFALLLVLDAFHALAPLESMIGELSVWSIILGIVLIWYMVERGRKGHFAELFVPLALLFMLFEKNISLLCGAVTPDLINNWILLLIALLLTVGTAVLMSAFGKGTGMFGEIEGHHAQDKRRAGGSFTRSTVYIDSATMMPSFVESNFGACEIYFENAEAYAGGGTLRVENNFGEMTVYVPIAWKVRARLQNSFGGITIPENQTPDTPELLLVGENNFGSMTIVYV